MDQVVLVEKAKKFAPNVGDILHGKVCLYHVISCS